MRPIPFLSARATGITAALVTKGIVFGARTGQAPSMAAAPVTGAAPSARSGS